MKLDKNYKVRVTPEQSREIHSLILLEGGEVSYGLKPQLQDEFLVVENDHDSVVIYYTDQDIFPTIENQEIQADDLIALLTDLLKSAENPPQDMKLKPGFETMEKLRLCYVHNVPNNPVFIDVDSVKQAIDIKEVIANVMLDLQENNQIPDFSNVFWLEVFEDDEWLEWTNEDGESFDEVSEL